MTAISKVTEHRTWKTAKEERYAGGGLVYCLSKYDTAFSTGLLNELTVLYNNGYELETLAERFKRPQMEILIALLHQADNGKITRPFAYRRKNK